MSDIREAGKGIAASLYGNDENLEVSELQLLFGMTELHQMKKDYEKCPEPNIFHDIQVDIDKVAADLEREVDRLMPGLDSPDYNKFLSRKAYTYNIRAGNERAMMICEGMEPLLVPKIRPEFPQKTIELLEEIKLDPVAVYFYIEALNLLGLSCIDSQTHTSIEHLTKAEETYNAFKAKVVDVKEALTPYQIFDVPKDIQTLKCLMIAHFNTNSYLYAAYNTLNDEKMKLKYVMPSIRAKLSINKSENNGKYIINTVIHEIVEEINFIIRKHHFAQANHLLSAFMNNLVQYRRSIPTNRHHEIFHSQALVSLAYATWGFEIVQYSFMTLTGNDGDDLEPTNDFYVFDDLITPGIEIYADQFPCSQIQTHKELKQSIKRGKSWCRRALDMMQNSSYLNYADKLMEQFDQLKKDLQYFEGME